MRERVCTMLVKRHSAVASVSEPVHNSRFYVLGFGVWQELSSSCAEICTCSTCSSESQPRNSNLLIEQFAHDRSSVAYLGRRFAGNRTQGLAGLN